MYVQPFGWPARENVQPVLLKLGKTRNRPGWSNAGKNVTGSDEVTREKTSNRPGLNSAGKQSSGLN